MFTLVISLIFYTIFNNEIRGNIVQIFSLKRILVVHDKNHNTPEIFTPLLHTKKK